MKLEGDLGEEGKSQETDLSRYILGQYENMNIFLQGMSGRAALGVKNLRWEV